MKLSFGKTVAVTFTVVAVFMLGGCESDDGGGETQIPVKASCPCSVRGKLFLWGNTQGTVSCNEAFDSRVVVFTGDTTITPVCLNKKGFELKVSANGPIVLFVARPDGTSSKSVTITLPDGGKLVGIGEAQVGVAGTTVVTVTTPEEATGTSVP